MKVKIFGAGSIGIHLAQASRRKGWEVLVVDVNKDALDRMKNEIYPARYGSWDSKIELALVTEAPKGGFDIIFIGTPPDVRMKVALEALKEEPKVLQLEKPFFVPMINDNKKAEYQNFLTELEKHDTKVVVGYEYVLGEATSKVRKFIANSDFGKVKILEVAFRENWKGIFGAHPWLSGPQDTYLGFWERGGGASGEHSHAIHYWQYFANLLDIGKVSEVSASMKMMSDSAIDCDEQCFMTLITEKGFISRIVQDVVTDPPLMSMRIQREKAFAEWYRFAEPGKGNVELIKLAELNDKGGWDVKEEKIYVKRPDDFYHEICHIADIMENRQDIESSPIGLKTGISAMEIVTAAHLSRLNNSSCQTLGIK